MVVALMADAPLRIMVVARLPATADAPLLVSAAAIPPRAATAAGLRMAVRRTVADRTGAAAAGMGGNTPDSVPAR
jgi:hypothetical protein